MEMKSSRSKILWITGTGMLTALLITLQWATSGLGQYVTGTCVNCVLAVAVLSVGLGSGVAVAVLSPFCAFLLGIGPQLLQLIPAIVLGNLAYILCLRLLNDNLGKMLWCRGLTVAVSAFVKFLILYASVKLVLIPAMGPSLPVAQAKMLGIMFSWPQLVTALLGGVAAQLVVPAIRRVLKK